MSAYPVAGVKNPATKAMLTRQTVDERAETNALDYALYM
jgi:hypothetical protein